MIAPIFVLAILLVARVSADVPSVVDVSQAQPVPVHHHIVSDQPESHHHAGVVGSPVVAGEHQHHQQVVHQHQHQPQQPQYYSSPSGLIQPVEQPQQPILKQYSPAAPVAAEQYGQPESASIPPNYKPFGSWGLYIGGNPADGYYSSYYKALGQSVSDKQQPQQVAPVAPVSGADAQLKPAGGLVSQASGFAPGSQQPLLKQAFTGYQDQQAYPYESSSSYYTPADLNSGVSRISYAPQGSQFGPAVYNYVEQPSVSGLSYASSAFAPEQYSGTKRSSSSASSSFATKSRDVQVVPQAPVKGYQQQQQQQGYYSYAAGVPAFAYQSPVEHHQYHHQQVVAYPVPVGSQIVGSQPGVEGAYAPFGVHGFTRYAVKPTVVAAPAVQQHSAPVYKQVVGYQQPLSFYGYPLSQLHYSQGSPFFNQQAGSQVESQGSPASGVQSHPQVGEHPQGAAAAPAAHIPFGYPVEAASSDKSESTVENKPAAAPVQPVKPTTTTQ